MTPEARMRAALEPKSSVPSRAVKAIRSAWIIYAGAGHPKATD
jgi:hypothetical protein